ncbi:MAG: radical SAM protein, partial [Deltaproteobacteria bacterium]|nr:radical SAM protein [Deltaproteobacteria bacterium]
MKKCPDTKSVNRPDAVPPLRHLYMYLTEGCNLACRHCWLSPKRVQEGKPFPFLPMAKFETVILEAKPLGLAGVKLTGGEPLLHPRVEEMFDFIGRHALHLSMETNG